ncbi:hypothetical protein LINPERHAP2_LOCUS38102 [Linum perenne]
MAEWSKAPDSSSGLRKRAWVQIPLLTFVFILHFKADFDTNLAWLLLSSVMLFSI